MATTFYANDDQFAASSGSNIDATPSYSYFDHPPNSTSGLTITSNMGDENPQLFEVGETYDLTWSGHGGGIMEDATIIRSDYLGPGEGAIVFEGTNSVTGEPFQMIWTPGFDLEAWYWDNGGGPSSPNAFWTSDQNTSETYQTVCFAATTLIETPAGARPVEALLCGDLVMTLDNGAVPIRWMRHQEQTFKASEKDTRPVLISANALGAGRPARDLIVSPQHRVLLGGQGQMAGLFKCEIFAPAKALTSLKGIRHMNGKKQITWIHFACDTHEIIRANGCLSETLLLGPMVIEGLSPKQLKTVTQIFGPAPVPDMALNGPPARDCLAVGAVRRKIKAHLKEDRNCTTQDVKKWEEDLALDQNERIRAQVNKPKAPNSNRAA